MNGLVNRTPGRGIASLRRFIADRPRVERCELCSIAVGDEHPHLVDPRERRILCVCHACALLFDDTGVTKYRRVPRDVREPEGFDISDQFWNALAIPIGLVFFFHSSVTGEIMALYPSPAGPTETMVDKNDWDEMAALHPAIGGLRADVEALVVNRTNGAREYFIVPIDDCYKLTGIIRQQWQGFSGGDAVWQSVRDFFDALKARSYPERMATRA